MPATHRLPASTLFHFPAAARRDPVVEGWLQARDDAPGAPARRWFEALRRCGEDVRELLHDGQPTACVGDAAFAYVDAFARHANLGFFQGAGLADPAGLLQGAGKRMRHVKLRPGHEVDDDALAALVEAAYRDMRRRVAIEDAGATR